MIVDLLSFLLYCKVITLLYSGQITGSSDFKWSGQIVGTWDEYAYLGLPTTTVSELLVLIFFSSFYFLSIQFINGTIKLVDPF